MAVVEVHDLTKRYGDKVVVDGVSFEVAEGEIFGILGPNGAGKTTTVECISGLRTPDSGRIDVAGLDPRRDAAALTQVLGVQLQESRLQDRIRVGEALDLYSSFYDDPIDWRELVEMLDLTDQLTTGFKKLSGGQKQRLSIALALVGRPKVAILDELTTGLDPRARRDTWALIERVRDSGVTILLVTHFMEEAQSLCDRLAIIDSGRIVAIDSPSGLVKRASDVQVLRFTPSAPLDETDLHLLEGVDDVRREGRELVVTGSGNVVHTVIGHLARHEIIANELRVTQQTLDDAFIALTGRPLDEPDETPEITR